jgi:hypothetical protein
MGFLPFYYGDVYSTIHNHMNNILNEVRSLDNSYVLRTSPSELEQFYLG